MIKINLALKKQAVAVDAKDKGGGGGKGFRFDPEALKAIFEDAQIRKLILVVLVAVLGTYLINGYEDDQLARMDQRIAQANVEDAKVKAELAKTAGYDALKKQFDEDEELIKTKLSTIQKLISDRQVPPKILASLAGIIPKNVWITDMSLNDDNIEIKGSSLGFDDITDFMKSLGDSEYLADLKLKDSQKEKTQQGLSVATFDIEAKRK